MKSFLRLLAVGGALTLLVITAAFGVIDSNQNDLEPYQLKTIDGKDITVKISYTALKPLKGGDTLSIEPAVVNGHNSFVLVNEPRRARIDRTFGGCALKALWQ